VTRSPIRGRASQSALTAVSTVPASTGPLGRHPVRHRHDRVGRHHVRGLVRVEAEHGPPEQLGRPAVTVPTLR
jgi:hypothetical protein